MGFGFNLFMIFIFLPFIGIILVVWLLSRKKIFGKIIAISCLGILSLTFLSITIHWFTAKKKLKKKDYYGQYIVNRNYFKGEQTDWQYNTFRFEITENDSIRFYLTDKEKILKIYRGTITTTESYSSKRLIINMEQPTFHILTSNPTTYRSAWSFYLVFYSPKFNNMFFKKGKWKSIEE